MIWLASFYVLLSIYICEVMIKGPSDYCAYLLGLFLHPIKTQINRRQPLGDIS